MKASCMKVARHNYRAVRKGRSLRQPRRYLQGINPDTGGITQVLSLDLLRAYDQCTLLHCTVERASHKKRPQWKVITQWLPNDNGWNRKVADFLQLFTCNSWCLQLNLHRCMVKLMEQAVRLCDCRFTPTRKLIDRRHLTVLWQVKIYP